MSKCTGHTRLMLEDMQTLWQRTTPNGSTFAATVAMNQQAAPTASTKPASALASELPLSAPISTHGYIATDPPLGTVDTGGQVVYVLEFAKRLGQLGYAVDILTRRFARQATLEAVDDRVRIARAACGGADFLPKEYLHSKLGEWAKKVEDARSELLKATVGSDTYSATGILAERVMDGLRHWGVIDPRPARSRLPTAAAGRAQGPSLPDGATE